VSGAELITLLLILAAFALGWWGRGRRSRPPPASDPAADELDQTLRFALTAFQAALSLWQAQDQGQPTHSLLAAQSVAEFRRRRAALAAAALPAQTTPEALRAYEQAQRAADRLAAGLTAFADGLPLDVQRERTLVSAERSLTAARTELRATLLNDRRAPPVRAS
jgi:hypothetical protein